MGRAILLTGNKAMSLEARIKELWNSCVVMSVDGPQEMHPASVERAMRTLVNEALEMAKNQSVNWGYEDDLDFMHALENLKVKP